jgi:tetratricopeptide (TPR) repeat protein
MYKRKVFIVLTIYLCSNLLHSQSKDALINKAITFCSEKKIDSAEVYFNAASKLKGSNKRLLSAEVSCNMSAAQYDKALRCADALILADTVDAESYYTRGMVRSRRLASDTACVLDYLTAARLQPDYFNAIYNAGAFYFTRNQDLKRQAKVCPQPLVVSDERKYYLEKAMVYFERALALKPKNGIVSNALLSIYKDLGLLEKAIVLKEMLDEEFRSPLLEEIPSH